MAIKKSKGSLFTEINITPLTDIFLVLLIIMMVIAPTFQSNDNNIDARSKEIMKVMQAAQAAEYEKLIVAGEPLSKKEQNALQNLENSEENQNNDEYRGTLGEIPSEE